MNDLISIALYFHDKFNKYPHVTFEDVENYGANFLIWKEETLATKENGRFYKIGRTIKTAFWFIDGWKYIPFGLMLFDDLNFYPTITLDEKERG